MERVECLIEQASVEVGGIWLDGHRPFGHESIGQTCPSPPPPVVVPYYPIRHRQQPRPGGRARRNSVESTPGHSEYLGGGVFTIDRPEAPKAVPINSEVVILEERVEFVLQIVLSFRCTRTGHFAMLCVRSGPLPYALVGR